MALPANISTGRVEGQFLVGVADGPDADDEPEGLPASGTVTFTASVPYLPDPTSAPNPATVLKVPIVAVLDQDGYLCAPDPSDPTKAGRRGIRLIATDDPDLSVQGWTWTVTYTFGAVNGVRPQVPSHSIAVPGGGVVDLTTAVKVPSSTGIGVEQAEALVAVAQAAAVEASAAAAAASEAAQATDAGVASLLAGEGATGEMFAGKVSKGEIAVNVRDYGVVLDGSAVTGTQLAAAVQAATTRGLPLRLPRGTFSFDQVVLPDGATIEGSGPGTVIQQSRSSQPTFMAIGGLSPIGPLVADLPAGATTFTHPQAGTLSVGDLLLVTDGVSYAPTDSAYKSGEQLRVSAVEGDTITVDTPVRGSFAAGEAYAVANSATLQKINPARNITLRNMAFKGHPDATASMLHFQRVDNLTIEGVSTISGQNSFCLIDTSRNVHVSRSAIHGLVDNHSMGRPAYGFIVRHACHNVTITNIISTMARHAVTTIGGPYGIPRLLTFSNIVSSDRTSTAGVDTHAAAEGVLITGCMIEGSGIGITSRGRNITVRGNTIRGTASYGVTVAETARNILIMDNDFSGCKQVAINIGQSGSTHSDIEVRGNSVRDVAGRGIRSSAGMTGLRIVLNTITRATGAAIDVDAGSVDVHIAGNAIRDASLSDNAPGINATGAQAAGAFDIVGNTVTQSSPQMGRAVHTTRTQGRMVGNRAFGTFVSTGTEFNAGAGFVKAENTLYA